jgi:succinyl-diaminopimelate desuccinylase
MTEQPSPALRIARTLVQCPSVTPAEGGALSALEATLSEAGFRVDRVVFSDADTPDVENLFASIGTGHPHFVFAGHTDVVPPGNETDWTHGPFDGTVENGTLYGRGTVDMKGGIASFAAAALEFVQRRGPDFGGTISFLITGDEEGPAVNGTVKLLDWAKANGQSFDACIVGEPTNPERLGDAIKVGRRGSLSGTVTVTGIQGHAAYPHLANNPIPGLVKLLSGWTTWFSMPGTNGFSRQTWKSSPWMSATRRSTSYRLGPRHGSISGSTTTWTLESLRAKIPIRWKQPRRKGSIGQSSSSGMPVNRS